MGAPDRRQLDELTSFASAAYPHGEIGSKIQRRIGAFVESRRLGRTFDSSQGFELGSGDTVEPDHSFVSNERWDAAPPPVEGEFLRVFVLDNRRYDAGTCHAEGELVRSEVFAGLALGVSDLLPD